MGDSTPLGRKVRELRKRERLTQDALAKRVGVERTYISQIERGKTKSPSGDVIKGLAVALSATTDELSRAMLGEPPQRGLLVGISPRVIEAIHDADDDAARELTDFVLEWLRGRGIADDAQLAALRTDVAARRLKQIGQPLANGDTLDSQRSGDR